MSERLGFLMQSAHETLGPRNGTHEVIDFRPDDDGGYICGWLAPSDPGTVEELHDLDVPAMESEGTDETVAPLDESGDDIPTEADPSGAQGSEDQDAGPQVAGRAGQPSIPSLEPGRMPSIMGLTFLAEGDPISFEVCATWARYQKSTDISAEMETGKVVTWKRAPKGAIRQVTISSEATHLGPIDLGDSGLKLEFRIGRTRTAGIRSISVYLVNRSVKMPGESRTLMVVFQPQIRIRTTGGTHVHQWPDLPSPKHDPDVDRMKLLYRDRPMMARGHLCGVMWHDIDPERAIQELEEFGIPTGFPFFWEDGYAALPKEEADRFLRPELRTDFLPTATVFSPKPDWDVDSGPSPEFRPWNLSECTTAEMIHQALDPLPAAYAKWIKRMGDEIPGLPLELRDIAALNLSRCTATKELIKEGIDVLAQDELARLAFCFANQAMGEQSVWGRRQLKDADAESPYPWRPFQLAFLLMEIPAIIHRAGDRRETCDLLWFPTGGGKTEAYLAVAAFVMAWRRLVARANDTTEGYGVAVLSRYTLRLLTIQQFRRALSLVTACEKLRCLNWLPQTWHATSDHVWGGERFGIGLWVGSAVTPASLIGSWQFPGALEILQGILPKDSADPAQILNCPCCGAVLAVTQEHLRKDAPLILHWVCQWVGDTTLPDITGQSPDGSFNINAARLAGEGEFRTLTIETTVLQSLEGGTMTPVQALWEHVRGRLHASGISAYLQPGGGNRADRPGYFIRNAKWGKMKAEKAVDFEIICPSGNCGLDLDWSESRQGVATTVPVPFLTSAGNSRKIPIPASTVDGQIYGRCPSMIVATVDKFAMLPYRPEAATMFGIVDVFAPHLGYWRNDIVSPKGTPAVIQWTPAGGFLPPDLVLQDELHLIEGPLGSMVGLYETALDTLMSRWDPTTGARTFRSHYVASSATVRAADDQVQSLYARSLNIFPPPGINSADSFFARTPTDSHPYDPKGRGRIYLGICAPGSSPFIPPRNLWAKLLQYGQDRMAAGADSSKLDGFWTIVNYYNAIRELAGASRMVGTDVQERLAKLQDNESLRRKKRDNLIIELSSRTDSMKLPGLLDGLAVRLDKDPLHCADMLHTTSMFGTGVDVSRLSLMIVHGQPKTASAYIQATGRVGREEPGLILTLHRAGRPRDLSHYEFFTGFHGGLYRYVEPITVAPFSPRAVERASGPIGVLLLRLSEYIRGVPVPSTFRAQPGTISSMRHDPSVKLIPKILEERAALMPSSRRPKGGDTSDMTEGMLDTWDRRFQDTGGLPFAYNEWTLSKPASKMVVLGDAAHREVLPAHVAGAVVRPPVNPACAFPNTPTSMREVEATTAFGERCESPAKPKGSKGAGSGNSQAAAPKGAK